MTVDHSGHATAQAEARDRRPGIWRLDDIEFDEASFQLRLRGHRVPVERMPLKVLLCLLRAGLQAVSSDELLTSIWHRSRDSISRNAVSNAVAKLRRALGEEGQRLIVAAPPAGYRLTQLPLFVERTDRPDLSAWLVRGQPVPHNPGWSLTHPIREGTTSAIWSAIHMDGQQAVFKFALFRDVHLAGLRREWHIARQLHAALGDRPAFLQPLAANFDQAPYFLCSPWAGDSLVRWARAAGGLASLTLERRLSVLAAAAAAMGEAHSVGILHKDLKPDNVLLDELPTGTSGGPPSVCIIDFGSGRLPQLPTAPGDRNSLVADMPDSELRQTLMYLAPERMVGQPATVASDIFTFGVMLYQMVIADFDRPISPSWRHDVVDPLLREDIEAATHGDIARRLGSLQELVTRLRNLDGRRAGRAELLRREQEMARTHELLRLAQARRPWMLAAGIVLMIGTAVSWYFAYQASEQRAEARSEYQRAQSINDFLAVGLLQTANPAIGGRPDITLREAMRRAGDRLDADLRNAPGTAAALHQAIANNFLALLDFETALPHFRRAVEISTDFFGPYADATLNARCDLGSVMLAAGADLDDAAPIEFAAKDALKHPAALKLATRCKCHQFLAKISGARGDFHGASLQFEQAAELAALNPSATPRQRGLSRAAYGQSLAKIGRAVEGLAITRSVAADFEARFGADHYDAIMAHYMIARGLTGSGQYSEAHQEYRKILQRIEQRFGPGTDFERHLSKEMASLPGS